MSETIFIPKLETRNTNHNGVKKYVIRGYASIPNHVYAYNKISDKNGTPIRALKEYFTSDALKSIERKAKNEKIFVDYGHQIGSMINVRSALNDIEKKTGLNISDEKNYIFEALKTSDIPLFKLEKLEIDDKGLFVEIMANPHYQEVDDSHKQYFNAVWNSLESGFINGMSFNFKPTSFVQINNDLVQINDADVFGISLLNGAANDMASITEVMMRCVQHVRGEKECPKKKVKTSLML